MASRKSARTNDPIISRLREAINMFDSTLTTSSADLQTKRKIPTNESDDIDEEIKSNTSLLAHHDDSSEPNTNISNSVKSSNNTRSKIKTTVSSSGKKKRKPGMKDDYETSGDEDQKDVHGVQNNNEEDDPFFFEDLRDWNLEEKLNSSNIKYSGSFVKFLDAKSFNFKYIQENGLSSPLVFKEKSGLGMRVPSENFKVSDVKACVGSKRQIDVMDVNTQKGLTMSMKDWCEYYEKPRVPADPLLNVISLEFSHTKLENYVEAPQVVRNLDWIELAWPAHLRATHTESTNVIDKMKYPKVQKYVLMSVTGCYTDFHIDMAGSTVWYHILKGEKVFWLIPPTENNLRAYTKWVMSGQQASVFFADMADQCQRITLKQGWTFMLPSGWIHAVYTTKDSLVFGGNFLHSFNVDMQLRIHQIEAKTRVPQKYRYPFFTQMLWFVLERYVHCLTGVTYLDNSIESGDDCCDFSWIKSERKPYRTSQPVDISSDLFTNNKELAGLKLIYEFLRSLTETKRQVPAQIIQPDLLLASFKCLVEDIENSVVKAPIEAPSGIPFTQLPKEKRPSLIKKFKKNKEEETFRIVETINKSENDCSSEYGGQERTKKEKKSSGESMSTEVRKHIMRNLPRTKGSIKKRLRPMNVPRSNVERRRRVRCHHCEPCTRDDCGECKYCKDMKKFGGTGVSKQCCLSKQCLQPLLPTTTTCMYCQKLIDRFYEEEGNVMYECEICFEIYHEQCIRKKYNIYDVEPVINEDLKNCWQCVCCVNKGYTKGAMTGSLSQIGGSQETDSSFHSSDLLNNSFGSGFSSFNQNSNCSSDFFVSPISAQSNDSASMAQASPPPQTLKKKRLRRTKEQIQTAKLNINDNQSIDKHPNNFLTVETLTHFQKQLILREFCEIVYDSCNTRRLPASVALPATNDDDQIILTDGDDDNDGQDWAAASISPSARTDFSEDYVNSVAANSSFSTSSKSPKKTKLSNRNVVRSAANKTNVLKNNKNNDSDVIYIDPDPVDFYCEYDQEEYYAEESIDSTMCRRNRSSLASNIQENDINGSSIAKSTHLIVKSNSMTKAH